MKFSISKNVFLEYLLKVLPFIERKTTIPILANVLIKAIGSTVTLTGTDLDVSMRETFTSKVKNEGQLTAPIRKLIDCLKALKNVETENVTISSRDNWLHLQCGDLKVKLVGMEPKSFPVLPSFPSGKNITVDAQVLRGLIVRSKYAISNEESRYTLNGGLLLVQPARIALVTTDGHRLAFAEHLGEFSQEKRLLLPKKLIVELKELLEDGQVEVANDETTIFFRTPAWTVTARPLTGNFPNYEAVIPRENGNHITLTQERLKATLVRVSQFADERSRAVKIELLPGKGAKVSASNTEMGSAEELIKSSYDGKPIAIGFNVGYLLDMLSTLSKEAELDLHFRDAMSPGLFLPRGDQFNTKHILMPYRV